MIMNEYETIYVARPDLTEDVMSKMTARFEQLINDNRGTLLVSEDWGKRKLAYVVARHHRGHYIYLNYVGPSTIVLEVERNLRNEDQLLRFLTVKLDDSVDVDVARQLAEERQRIRRARLEQLKLEEENEARWREGEEDEDQPVEESPE
jgi:small subunit ribosomal protein S6